MTIAETAPTAQTHKIIMAKRGGNMADIGRYTADAGRYTAETGRDVAEDGGKTTNWSSIP